MSSSACPTCAPISVEAAVESGRAGGVSASYVHCADAAPLTAAIAEEFGLERLAAFLEQPNVVVGHFGAEGSQQAAPPAVPTAAVELEFDVGEFGYYKKTADASAGCDDSIAADAHVTVRIGDDLLAFEADGRLWQGKHEPSAHFYADADLALATGTYRPALDVTRAHVGKISLALSVAPGHLRGNITPFVVYFRDEARLQRYRQGDWGAYAELAVLFRIGFPDDECGASQLPFAHDEAILVLGGASADAWRARAAALVGATASVDAVWNDGSETVVAVELGEPLPGTACLGESYSPAPASEFALRIPLQGRLRSADARLDIPIDAIILGIDAGSVARAGVQSLLPAARLSETDRMALGTNADVLSVRLNYDFTRDPGTWDGVVELRTTAGPNGSMRVGCLAFPPGGKGDTGTCRFVYIPPSVR